MTGVSPDPRYITYDYNNNNDINCKVAIGSRTMGIPFHFWIFGCVMNF